MQQQQYVILTDSTGDLSADLVREAGVEVIPMEFALGGQVYHNYPDNRELAPDAFYDRLRAGETATTAQVNLHTYQQTIEPFLQAGRDVLLLIFSSGLSGSYDTCRMAVEKLARRYPERALRAVDTRAASMGEGLLVFLAAQQRAQGKTLGETALWAESHRDRLCHWFTVDDLHFLHRGGRVSRAAAVMGTMLSIKPVLHVDDDGHLIAMEKVRGRRQSLDALVAHLEQTITVGASDTVFVSHGGCRADAEYVAAQLRGRFGIRRIEIGDIGPVIGSHSGPGTVALFWLGSRK